MLNTITAELTNFILLNVHMIVVLVILKAYMHKKDKNLLLVASGYTVAILFPVILQLFSKGMWYSAKDPIFVNIQTIFAIVMLVGIGKFLQGYKNGSL